MESTSAPVGSRESHRSSFSDGIQLRVTPAWEAGESKVWQCAWCGTLVAPDTRKQPGACPACAKSTWWEQSLPVGPFCKCGEDDE